VVARDRRSAAEAGRQIEIYCVCRLTCHRGASKVLEKRRQRRRNSRRTPQEIGWGIDANQDEPKERKAASDGGLQAGKEQILVVQVHLEREAHPEEHEANE
jgi:hypothetical protein